MKAIIKKIVPQSLIDVYHYFSSLAGALRYGFPSKEIKVISVTGTNGKSTVVNLTSRILKEAGYKTASFSSVAFRIGSEEEPNKLRMTMPEGFSLQRFLRRAVNEKCDYAVLEVTSEGVKQYRHKFIDFELVAITNLTPEHIESHGGFENYRKAKAKLFQVIKKIHVVNLDDEQAEYFLQFPAQKKYGYRIKSSSQNTGLLKNKENMRVIEARNESVSESGVEFSINNIKMQLPLLGRFNIYNALAAICICLSQGVDLDVCKEGLKKTKGIPGRMEMVIFQPFRLIVDYAFTPNALNQVYKTIKENFSPQNLICVLGSCGGGRDKWKRPILGESAAKYCDTIIVTNEDPYDEDPMEIINQVAEGTHGKALKILERKEAIKKALQSARPNDLVVITGKGSEPSICLAGGKQIPWDDRRVAKELFNELNEDKK